jgi:GNAT superfamily N-acetyltransferase
VKFQAELIRDVLDEVKPLLDLHWHEIAHYQDIPLEPDYDFYVTCSDIRFFTARDGDRLIGYGLFFVSHNKHYSRSVYAVQDILFLHPDYRGGRTGVDLIRFCDQELKREGCQVVCQHIKAAHNFGPLLERLGYELVDLIYAKRLDKE